MHSIAPLVSSLRSHWLIVTVPKSSNRAADRQLNQNGLPLAISLPVELPAHQHPQPGLRHVALDRRLGQRHLLSRLARH